MGHFDVRPPRRLSQAPDSVGDLLVGVVEPQSHGVSLQGTIGISDGVVKLSQPELRLETQAPIDPGGGQKGSLGLVGVSQHLGVLTQAEEIGYGTGLAGSILEQLDETLPLAGTVKGFDQKFEFLRTGRVGPIHPLEGDDRLAWAFKGQERPAPANVGNEGGVNDPGVLIPLGQ